MEADAKVFAAVMGHLKEADPQHTVLQRDPNMEGGRPGHRSAKPQQDWCKARNMEYMCHLNHEELMMTRGGGEDLIKNEGSFFRDMRYVGVPGIDNLNQIRPGLVTDFPKLASSAAHLFGRPLIWT